MLANGRESIKHIESGNISVLSALSFIFHVLHPGRRWSCEIGREWEDVV